MEDSKSNKEVETKQVEMERMEQLLKNISRLLLAFGSSMIFGMVIVWATSYRVSAEVIVLGMLMGSFLVTSGLAINKSYSFGFKKLLPRKAPRFDTWLRIRNNEEVMTEMPSAYLALSGLVMVAGSASMIAGDCLISNLSYRKVPHYVKGDNFAFAGCTFIFVTAAGLGFALAMLTKMKHLKTIVACFFLASLAGAIAAASLNYVYEGPYHYSSMEFTRRIMQKDLEGSYIKGQDYPSANISMWLIMKFASAEIIMAFSCFNVLLAATFYVDIKSGIKKSSPSVLLGILGIIVIASGLALEVVNDLLLSSNIMTSGHSWMLQYTRPIVAISTLIAGIHAFHGFYSAGNLRKFTLFFLSLAVIASSVSAIFGVLSFRTDALEVETVAMSPCSMNPDHTAQYCVYNTTLDNFTRWVRLRRENHEELQPPLACIPKRKLCDGKADLFVDKMDEYYYGTDRGYGNKLRFCGDIRKDYGMYNPTPIDEVACYTMTALPYLVVAAIAILVTIATCAFATLVITSTSLPPAICFVFSNVKWLFGITSEDEEEDRVPDDEATETEALHG